MIHLAHGLAAVLWAHAFTIWWRAGFPSAADLCQRKSIEHALLASEGRAS